MRLIGLAVVLAVSLSFAPLAAEGQPATIGLAFHQAVTASVGLADPARFERLKLPVEEADVYVERTAALVIPLMKLRPLSSPVNRSMPMPLRAQKRFAAG